MNKAPLQYCRNPFLHERRPTRIVTVGSVSMGGEHPVVPQSMIVCDTMNTQGAVKETLALVEAGCEIVRITAPTVKDAANLRQIRAELDALGVKVPLVADIHFKPDAAMEAARWIEAVRINPGNFADSKKFKTHEYTGEDYAEELQRVDEAFRPLVELAKERGIKMRIGVNHGSLSDRIMSRYGDTPRGMVESAMEFARIARKYGFHNFVFSMKASNPKVMIAAYRLLAATLAAEGEDWNYPFHTGVTEAGEGEDGRIKSAIGIGALLVDGLGDTIRVSLSEDSPHEIPVCRDLISIIPSLTRCEKDISSFIIKETRDPFSFSRRVSEMIEREGISFGGEQVVRVVVTEKNWDALPAAMRNGADVRPEGVYEKLGVMEVNPLTEFTPESGRIIAVADNVGIPPVAAYRMLAARLDAMGARNPILLKDTLEPSSQDSPSSLSLLASSVVLGALLCDGIGDAILLRRDPSPESALVLSYNILQAAGCRSFKTEYVACPSCGRTLYDLQAVIAKIKSRTQHLKGVKIAIMGCIVNGPGEMADADFGYVGGAPGKINLYVGKTPVKFNIPENEAVDRLVDLIREHDKWRDL